MIRKCNCCGRELPITEFYYKPCRQRYDTYCKECRRTKNKRRSEAQKERIQHRVNEHLDRIAAEAMANGTSYGMYVGRNGTT